MNKLLTLALLVFITFGVNGQAKNTGINKLISNSEIINQVQKSLSSTSAIVWSDDFSVASNWSMSNQTNDNQDWVISTTGPSGTYSTAIGTLSSTSAGNGFAMFDSDLLGSSGGTQNASITNAVSIDLSSYNATTLSFHQRYRRFQTDQTYIGISTDGINWQSIQVNSLVTQGATVDNDVIVNISAYADNEALVWIRFQYVGSWDYVWMVDDVVIEGTSFNQAQILSITPNIGNQGESLFVSLSGQYTNFVQGSTTVCFQQATSTTTIAQTAPSVSWFQQATSTIFCGYNINVIDAFNFTFDLDVPAIAPPGMYDAKVTDPVDGLIVEPSAFEVVQINLPVSWNYTSTLVSHAIIIPDYAQLTIDGNALSIGDYLGVFFDNGTDMVCGGYVQWDGNTAQLSAWGDDVGTGVVDGFAVGDEFAWKVFDLSTSTDYDATASYQTAGFPNTSLFAVNGLSGVSALAALSIESQVLSLVSGWSIFSTYIDPLTPDIEDVFSPILSNIVIIKNGNGFVYWPPFVNLIGNMVIEEGYQVNLTAASSLTVNGSAVDPQNTPISLPSGWSIMAYLRQSPANIQVMLSPIVSQIIIAKNGSGEVYWPIWGVNGIGNMIPGEGYQVKLLSQQVLTYPANAPTSKDLITTSTYNPLYFNEAENTGANMSLAIPESAWSFEIRFGDEVAVLNNNELVVGSAVFTGSNMVITMWGNDELSASKDGLNENEAFQLHYYNHITGEKQRMVIREYISGNGLYKKDGISEAGRIETVSEIVFEELFPNPASNYTTIRFYTAHEEVIGISVYDNAGRLIESSNNSYMKGEHELRLDLSGYASGLYFCKIEGTDINNSLQFEVQ
jgi:hypothetical protein